MGVAMMKRCDKCKGLLVQGAETCIICGKTVKPADSPAPVPKATPEAPHFISFRSSAAIPGPQIRLVTAPGGRRIEESSTISAYKSKVI